MAQVLIADDEKIKAGRFKRMEKIAVFQFTSAHFHCRLDVMTRERLEHLHRGAYVQEDLHLANSTAMSSQP